MKGNGINFRTGIICFLCLFLSSCSWLTSRRSLFGDDEEDKKEKKTAPVSRKEYNDLKARYEALARSSSDVKKANNMANAFEKKSSDSLMNELESVPDRQTTELAETVDVFGTDDRSSAVSSIPVVSPYPANSMSGKAIESDIAQLRKAYRLYEQRKVDATMNAVKRIENSKVRQVQVRAKFLLGEILFIQGEWDLALQVYEEIIHKYAFSGVVIKVLGRLIVCAEKLNLKGKRERFYSILNDFFEQSV